MITSDPFIEWFRVASESGERQRGGRASPLLIVYVMMARLRRAQPTTNLTREIFFELEITIQAENS